MKKSSSKEEAVLVNPEVENKPLGIEETYEFKLSNKEWKIFDKRMNEYLERWKWLEIQDTTGRAMYFIVKRLVNNLQPLFKTDQISIELKYPDIWALNRISRIIQLDIGEENEDQALFQKINQDLFPII